MSQVTTFAVAQGQETVSCELGHLAIMRLTFQEIRNNTFVVFVLMVLNLQPDFPN